MATKKSAIETVKKYMDENNLVYQNYNNKMIQTLYTVEGNEEDRVVIFLLFHDNGIAISAMPGDYDVSQDKVSDVSSLIHRINLKMTDSFFKFNFNNNQILFYLFISYKLKITQQLIEDSLHHSVAAVILLLSSLRALENCSPQQAADIFYKKEE